MKLLPSRRVLCTPYNHAPYHLMQSRIRKVHAYLAVTCHLHFWQHATDPPFVCPSSLSSLLHVQHLLYPSLKYSVSLGCIAKETILNWSGHESWYGFVRSRQQQTVHYYLTRRDVPIRFGDIHLYGLWL